MLQLSIAQWWCLALSLPFTFFTVLIHAEGLPVCKESNYHYEYTECGSDGGRWKVYVPSEPDKCAVDDSISRPPVRGKECTFTCKAGEYMDVQGDQNCHPCPAGTYSLGGGQRFTDFSVMPKGFEENLESLQPSDNCSDSERWTAAGSWMAVLPTLCVSTLSYRVTLVRAGELSFEYSNDGDELMLAFKVATANCQSDLNGYNILNSTRKGEWKTKEVDLPSGLNVIIWSVFHYGIHKTAEKHLNPILLRRVSIDGVGYSSSCTPCPAGSYSKSGAGECKLCPVNTYSQASAAKCQDCDASSQYAGKGFSSCLPRPACKASDYFKFLTACDNKGMTQVMYKWIEPQICLPKKKGSVQLPPSGAKQKCPPCNPAMEVVNGTCSPCAEGEASDGRQACAPCPSGTQPYPGLFLSWWREPLFQSLVPSCVILTGKAGCRTERGWELRGDYISSGVGHADDSLLLLALSLPGFSVDESNGGDQSAQVGLISFVFDMQCQGRCRLVFVQGDNNAEKIRMITSFEGAHPETSYSYIVTSSKPTNFMWVFEKKPPQEAAMERKLTYEFTSDLVRIRTINVTNVLHAGAASCRDCGEARSCVRCPARQVQAPNSTSCVPCPKNSVSVADEDGGRRCKSCAPGLVASDTNTCVSDCTVIDSAGRMIDLRPLNHPTPAEATTLFSAQGRLQHRFNVSLCGQAGRPQARCVDSFESLSEEDSDSSVRAFVCRMIVFPDEKRPKLATTQPFGLGTTLVKIDVLTSGSMKSTRDNKTVTWSFMKTKLGYDIEDDTVVTNFYYSQPGVTSVCTSGFSVVVSVICDLRADGTFTTPRKYQEGTENGCDYYLVARSPHGCPVCRGEDYTNITEACRMGKQKVYSNPPKNCYNASGTPQQQVRVQSCPLLSREALIGIGAAALLAVILIALLVKFYKHNRKLEYKYMKLVESSTKDGSGELAAAETCGLSDTSEDEEDNIAFKKGSGAKAFFNKVAQKMKKEDDSFETMQLTGSGNA